MFESGFALRVYPYPIHYLYDFLVIGMMLLVGRSVYNLRLTKKQFVLFTSIMMVFYQINFLIVEELLPKEFKYITLYVGLLLVYVVVLRLKFIPALIVILSTTTFNGIWTNINIYFMLLFKFDNYGLALEAKHFQYTSYTVAILVLGGLTILFRLRVLDIQKYN